MKKRTKYTNIQKPDVINHSRDVNDVQHTITHLFPALSANARLTMSKNIYLWQKERQVLAQRYETGASGYNRTCGVATNLPPDSEQEVLDWVNMMRSEGVPVSNVMLCERAKAVAAERG